MKLTDAVTLLTVLLTSVAISKAGGPDSGNDPGTGSGFDPGTDPSPDPDPDINPDPGPDLNPDPGPDLNPDPGPDLNGPDSDLDFSPDLNPDLDPGSGPDPSPDAGPEPSLSTGSGPIPTAPQQIDILAVVAPVVAGCLLATTIVILLSFLLYRRCRRSRKFEPGVSFQATGTDRSSSRVNITGSHFTNTGKVIHQPADEDSLTNRQQSLYQDLLKNQGDGRGKSKQTREQTADDGTKLNQEDNQKYEIPIKKTNPNVRVSEPSVQPDYLQPIMKPRPSQLKSQPKSLKASSGVDYFYEDASSTELPNTGPKDVSAPEKVLESQAQSGTGDYAYVETGRDIIEYAYADQY
ncbi:uncharacterized protein LOC119730966 [Patiria miniata]|uniref:Uncharacterized protein n=1 Tax=Patiria miniata TaxID=46514 RepID=A0A914A7X3_PATMI|nr:uncharacterized protein LOC119730966 [Patiria miniata]